MADLPPPVFDQSQVPGWLDAQRKQQMAQMLMGAFQQTNQTPADWNSMRVVPKRGALGTIASLASALMAGKAQGSAMDAEQNYMMGRMGGGGSQQPQPQPDAGQTFNGPTGNISVPGQQPPSGNVQQPQNPMLPAGMTPQMADRYSMLPGGGAEVTKAIMARYMPTDMQKNDAYMGLTPQQRHTATLADALKGAVVPNSTATLNMDQNGNVMPNLIPGLQGNEAALQAATTAATQSQMPHEVKDAQGRPTFEYTTPPAAVGAPGTAKATGGAGLQTTAGAASQADFGKAGVEYATQINADAENALQGKRTLSEMGNLLQGFNPGQGAPVLSAIGGVAQALGVPSDTVQKFTKMDVGDTEAFQKGTANLAAEAAKQMTNKVTQQEFKVYLANNPNWMMTSNGIKRAMDFMGRGFDQTLDKQAMFQQFTANPKNDPGRYSVDFPAAYNAQTRQKITEGALNSAPAKLTGIRTQSDVAAGPPPQYTEGQIAHNPTTGAQLQFTNGRWIPVVTRPGQ